MSIQAGDILLYYSSNQTGSTKLAEELVQLGEELNNGKYSREYYHVAIAIAPEVKIEANGKNVDYRSIYPTDEEFDVFRLPYDESAINHAVAYIQTFRGQSYDWWCIADQGIRDLTGDLIHLPEGFIANKELHMKICSTLATIYALQAGVPDHPAEKFTSPQEFFLWIRNYAKLVKLSA